MADDKICILLPPEMRLQLIAIAETHGVSLSDVVRAMLASGISGVGALGGADYGFLEGRRLMRTMVRNLLGAAEEMLPATFDEAVARFGHEG